MMAMIVRNKRTIKSQVNKLPKCKDICIKYKATKTRGGSRYANGQKRCQVCEIFIRWDGMWCPCCGYRLRTTPRNKALKEKFHKSKEENDIKSKSNRS